jgi:CheY-like chemotaxis protein
MTTILVVEDDDAIRNNITRLLKLEGYGIVAAINGAIGLARARELRPDIVISDIGMPEMDGFQLLEALRADPALASTPVMLLTALDDRASMRRGMTAGADDYLAKPFTRVELLEALAGLQRKKDRIAQTVEQAVQSREAQLRAAFMESLGGRKQPDRIGLEAPQGALAEATVDATVLFADIRNFTALAARLGSGEVAELLTGWFERCCPPLLRQGGRHLKFIGDGVIAVFEEEPRDGVAPAARRAVVAGLSMALAAHEFRGWLERRFGDRALPPFAIGVGLHRGPVTLCRAPGAAESAVVGETVNVAARLEAASKELGWTLVASSAVLQSAGEGLQTGGMTSLAARGAGGYVDVGEVIGLDAREPEAPDVLADLARHTQELSAALQVNSEITARAVKGALHSKLAALKEHVFAPGHEPLRLRGYRLTRKIGAGGMTEVYLAEREADGLAVVLKVLDASGKRASEHLSRFIQEYALLSRIEHPNVVRIYDQGFTDDHAFIAMEYFAQGDLRSELGGGLPRRRALDVAGQVARALAAIHARGIIHRDLKPENIMRRADETVALADFGIAKSMLPADNLGFTQTRHGDVVGTPYYLSPEQAAGHEITPLSDLYSLGVMLWEMLAGERPFRAESLDLLLARHLNAPTPPLPAEHRALQPMVERLMAKRPQDRYPGAEAFLAELELHGFRPTVAPGD